LRGHEVISGMFLTVREQVSWLQRRALCRGGLAAAGLCEAVAHITVHHRNKAKTQANLRKLQEDAKLSRKRKVDAMADGAQLQQA